MLYLFKPYFVPLLFLVQYLAINTQRLVPERETGYFWQPLRQLTDAGFIALS